jgi:hypothetical protein
VGAPNNNYQQQQQRFLATHARPNIPTTMRAAVVEKFGAPLVIKNVPVPTPGKDDVLIKVRCHLLLALHAGDC